MNEPRSIPTIDISRYTNPKTAEDQAEVVQQFRDACSKDGFLQLVGHDVPLSIQRQMLSCTELLFSLPQHQKDAMSLKNFASRRGYEGLRQQTLDVESLPDMKEGFYIGREDDEKDIGFLRGPNVWPDLPDAVFKAPVMEYRQHLIKLGELLWELLAVSLGYSDAPAILSPLFHEPAVFLKPIRYPAHTSRDPRQFGAAAHADFGGITILLQQPGRHGLEVYVQSDDGSQQWVPVPAVENVFVVNMGDRIEKWTHGRYKSSLHRVINKGDGDRYSVPCFYQGNLDATNPFAPEEKQTVLEHVQSKFAKSFALPEGNQQDG